MVAGIVAGDPAALAAAYDHYAPALYLFSRSLLSEPAQAADAVLDTFLVAALRLPGLRDPGRLRPWLYAVTRNECHRRRNQEQSSAPGHDAADLPDDPEAGEATTDFGASLEEAELCELVSSALAGLDPGDRELVELSLRHELYGADLADAIGVPRSQAHALSSRARQRFDTAVSTLVAARTGYRSCAALAEILGSWEGELTQSMRREVRQHIAECAACGARRRRALGPSALLALLPVPALPGDLRYQVIGLITDGTADAVRYCAAVAERAEPFLRSGFPVPLDPLAPVRGLSSFLPAAGVLVAVFAVFGGGAMLAANSLDHPSTRGSSALIPATVPSAQPAPAASAPAPAQAPSGSKSRSQVTPVGIVNTQGVLPTMPASTTSAPAPPAPGTPGSPAPSHRSTQPPSPGRDPSPVPTGSSSTPAPSTSSSTPAPSTSSSTPAPSTSSPAPPPSTPPSSSPSLSTSSPAPPPSTPPSSSPSLSTSASGSGTPAATTGSG
jgi:RNA polymerase sigma factor (sigma-70 family)